jgi:hypothetical protein
LGKPDTIRFVLYGWQCQACEDPITTFASETGPPKTAVSSPLGVGCGRSFSLIQTDVKDILDKGALGTQRTTHLSRQGLPRYQWTACDGRTRLRFLAYSHRLNRTNGLTFLILVLMWLRAFGCETPVTSRLTGARSSAATTQTGSASCPRNS